MVFESLLGRKRTDHIFLGSPEAEAEVLPRSRVSLLEVYEDYHNLLPALSSEKFLILGRKGSGKSAFAEYVNAIANSEANLFSASVKASDFKIEKTIQLGNAADAAVDAESLFRWLIYTNILKLFTDNEAVQESKEFNLLQQFLNKNSGYINIKDFEIQSLIERNGFNVSTEQFRRFLRLSYKRDLETKSERAPYYKLIPHLEYVIVNALRSKREIDNENSYAIFFDDLDIWFSISSSKSADSIISLIRACRHVNNEVFGKNKIRAKAIILLRDDIEAYLSSRYADTAKLFSSYASRIDWYQEEYAGIQEKEKEINLKKFINRRIRYAFKKAGKECNPDNPWDSLVDVNASEKSTFKHVVNQTLFRPRDLLLFFKPLESGSFKYPLSKDEIHTLVEQYSDELAKEIKNELSSFYSDVQIANIFSTLFLLSRANFTYEQSVAAVVENCKDVDPQELLSYLFDRSIIGSHDGKGWYWFKCRQPANTSTSLEFNKNQRIVVQYGIRSHLSRRYMRSGGE